jgi:hypothetical protein
MSALSLDACRAVTDTASLDRPNGSVKASDWSGLWFKIIEDTRGEYVGMRGGKRRPDGSIEWTFLSHASYDGLGGFVHLLRRDHGAARVAVPVRKSRIPSLMARTVALLRLVAKKPEAAAAWKNMDQSAQVKRTMPGTAFATELFDPECTQQLTQKARALGIPLNSVLLAALGRASKGHLGAGPARWIMPVNMRGPVALANDTANQTGYLHIELPPDATPAQAHEQMKLALRRRDHWATWLFLNAGRIVGYRGIRAIYKMQMYRFEGRPFVGAFTNLGSWDGHGEWFVCPPVAATCPVSAGAIVCNGRLSLTIEAHPSVAGGATWARALMVRWITELRGIRIARPARTRVREW